MAGCSITDLQKELYNKYLKNVKVTYLNIILEIPLKTFLTEMVIRNVQFCFSFSENSLICFRIWICNDPKYPIESMNIQKKHNVRMKFQNNLRPICNSVWAPARAVCSSVSENLLKQLSHYRQMTKHKSRFTDVRSQTGVLKSG